MAETILVVEDEQPIMQALSEKLTGGGYTVIRSPNGADGLKQALAHHPNLILLDIIMPEMDGVTMLKELRKDSWGAKVPVIILSNLNNAGGVLDSLANGVYDYLVKADISLDSIVERVRQRLAQPL